MRRRKRIEIDIDAIIEGHRRGTPSTVLARQLGVSTHTVLRRAKEMGLEFGNFGRFSALCDGLPIVTLYRDWQWSLREIESAFDFPKPCLLLRRYLKARGCRLRTQNEQHAIHYKRKQAVLRDCKATEIAYYIRGERRVLNAKGEFGQ